MHLYHCPTLRPVYQLLTLLLLLVGAGAQAQQTAARIIRALAGRPSFPIRCANAADLDLV